MQLNSSIRRGQRGFTLLEVLVALIVLSIGLLGLSGLQTTGLRNNHSAFLRSQATLVIGDIIDRMRANRPGATGGHYNISYSASPGHVTCVGSCTTQQVASIDVELWRAYVERLPAGEGEVSVTAAGLAEVKVRWNDARDPANLLELVTRAQL
ncbi:MAG: type IV pilus modification protein PilV [Gammaproteobacteria bacterium]|nr:type IV pilus modification protein PilV [Gammaproteobacteria bacterium]